MGASSSITSTTSAGAGAGCGRMPPRSTGRSLIFDRHRRRRALDREREPEPRSPLEAILRPDPAPMRLDKTPADGQPEPDTFRPGDPTPVEFLEDTVRLAGGQPGAPIRNVHG